MIGQRDRERAVAGVAIRRRRSCLGRKRDHRVRTGRLDLGKPATNRARGQGALHRLGERVVAAGIEDDETELLGRLDGIQRAIKRDRLVEDVAVGFQHGIGRNEIVAAVQLDAVASIVNHRHVGIARPGRELA